MRLHIDWTACDGRGGCAELLPELLVADDRGYPMARTAAREPAVPSTMEPHARAAIRRCPRLAMHLVEERSGTASSTSRPRSRRRSGPRHAPAGRSG